MWSPFCKKRRLTRGFVIKGGTEGWAFWDNENKVLNLEMVLGKYNVKGSCSAGVCGAPSLPQFPHLSNGLGAAQVDCICSDKMVHTTKLVTIN